ncbi:MAG: hypothetical protein KC657_39555 [Myxococcales bacterium]|nr:hypothetical protein [Myxococcales bacterium]
MPRGPLSVEARVLRAEALAQRGDVAASRALAKGLLERDPNGPHARRLKKLLGENASGDKSP